MGRVLNAVCENCGFNKHVTFGSSRRGYKKLPVPALNRKTGELVSVDYYKWFNIFKKHIFYNNPKMYEGDLQNNSFQDRKVYINRTNNLCPNCKQFTMKFEVIIIID